MAMTRESELADPWRPPSLLFLPFKYLSLSLFFSLSRLCQCVTGFLPTFLLSCVRAVLLVINCLLSFFYLNSAGCGRGRGPAASESAGVPGRIGSLGPQFTA
jgi:hypothetical protein